MAERGDEQAATGRIVAYEEHARAGAAGAGMDDPTTNSTIQWWSAAEKPKDCRSCLWSNTELAHLRSHRRQPQRLLIEGTPAAGATLPIIISATISRMSANRQRWRGLTLRSCPLFDAPQAVEI
jgi:hypothetical protein